MNKEILRLLSEREAVNNEIIKCVKQEIENLPFAVDDQCINMASACRDWFWISKIEPEVLNHNVPTGCIDIRVNYPRKDGSRSLKETRFILDISAIKKMTL